MSGGWMRTGRAAATMRRNHGAQARIASEEGHRA